MPRDEAGADSIELHAGVPDDDSTMKEWKVVSESVPNGMISMCLDRKHLSNKMLLDLVLAHEIAGERLIIQADGIPMSGGVDNFNTTLQAVSIADLLNKELKDKERKFKNLPILSGGTNSLTDKLARQCDVRFNGITIGTHARKVIKSTRAKPDQISKEDLINAISKAKNLIENNLFKK